MVRLEIDSRELNAIAADLAATEPQAEKALNRTLRRMAAWLKTRAVRGMSDQLFIQQKVIRRRLKTFRIQKTPGGSKATVWFGLDPIALIHLQPKKAVGGVTASGGRSVAGGFIAKTPGGAKQVFKRVGKDRLPIQKRTASVKVQSEQYIDAKLVNAAEFQRQFWRTFEHELKWLKR